MQKAGLLLLRVFDTTVRFFNEEEMTFQSSFDSNRPFFSVGRRTEM